MADVAVCPACRGGGANVYYFGAPCHVCDGWRVVRVPPEPSTVPTESNHLVMGAANVPPEEIRPHG